MHADLDNLVTALDVEVLAAYSNVPELPSLDIGSNTSAIA
jgi:hypothetical protein